MIIAAFAQRAAPPNSLSLEFGRIRDATLALCSSLEIEDCVVQSMPEASPIKWHLAHTTWFLEQFVLAKMQDDYRAFDPSYEFLFNSYYEAVGPLYERRLRGVASRPTVAEIIRYRRYVDEATQNLLARNRTDDRLQALIVLGLNHEQQHQELMLTDIKHAFSCNPSLPVYRSNAGAVVHADDSQERGLKFIDIEGGLKRIGADDANFAFDNERPQYRVLVEPFALANRLVTNGEYLEFIRAGGYRNPQYWLSDGWDAVKGLKWARPLYWQESLDSEFTLHGIDELHLGAPACHISFYEADAFSRWAGKRLPTEIEWELAAQSSPVIGNLLSSEVLHPLAPGVADRQPIKQLFGDAWEWTASAYLAYPGYRTPEGALGEYNGKFMSGRMVLRGGSCVTPDEHVRATYRNYFDPKTRWQFAGVRLAH